jgi:hypothetical protein
MTQELAIDLFDELESQLFLEGKEKCKVCQMYDDIDNLKNGLCCDCIDHEVELETGVKLSSF